MLFNNFHGRLSFYAKIDQRLLEAVRVSEERVDVTDLHLTDSQTKKLLDLIGVTRMNLRESKNATVSLEEKDDSKSGLVEPEEHCPTRLSGLRLVVFAFGLLCFPIGLIGGFLLYSIPWGVVGCTLGLLSSWICLVLQFKQVDQLGGWSTLRERFPRGYESLATATQLLFGFSAVVALHVPLVLIGIWSAKVDGDSPNASAPSFAYRYPIVVVVSIIAAWTAIHFGKSYYPAVRGWCALNCPVAVFSPSYYSLAQTQTVDKAEVDPDRNPFFLHGKYLIGAIVAAIFACNFAYVEQLEKISGLMDDVPKRIGRLMLIAKAISGNRYPLLILGNILCSYFVYQYSHRLCVSFKLARPIWKAAAITSLVALIVAAASLVAWALSG